MVRRIVAALLLCLACPNAAFAANSTLSLDVFSFFYFGGLEAGGLMPLVSVPVTLTEFNSSLWSIEVEAGSLGLPPLDLPNGTQVTWQLTSNAVGTIAVSGTTATVTLQGSFLAMQSNRSLETPFNLQFTTGTATASAGTNSISRQGVALDRASGYLQLVAADVDPPTSQHGVPFYAVISGTLSLPPGLALP